MYTYIYVYTHNMYIYIYIICIYVYIYMEYVYIWNIPTDIWDELYGLWKIKPRILCFCASKTMPATYVGIVEQVAGPILLR